MNWRRVVRGYLEGEEAIWVSDCACHDRPHIYPPTRLGHMTIKEREYLMVIRPALLLYRHGLNYQLIKNLLYRFNCQFGLDQVVPVTGIPIISHEDPKLYSHTDKKGENSLVQVAKAWRHTLS